MAIITGGRKKAFVNDFYESSMGHYGVGEGRTEEQMKPMT